MITESVCDIHLRSECNRVEEVLAELERTVAPEVWAKISRVLAVTINLYGAGLERALAHARATGAGGDFDARLAADDLLARLLLMHDLHPHGTAQRIEAALAPLRLALDAELVVHRLEDGVLYMTAPAGTDAMIRRVLANAAPELRGLELADEHARVALAS